MKKYSLLIMTFFITETILAQLSKNFIDSAINDLLTTIDRNYVFPQKSKEIHTSLHEKNRSGKYTNIVDKKALALELTIDLQAISKDRHLRVRYDPLVKEVYKEDTKPNEDLPLQQTLQEEHFGIKKIDSLTGNIGYLNIRLFGPLDFCADTISYAMNKLAGMNALIIDLRECRGSMDKNAIAFFSGYFFAKPVYLNDLYYRTTGDTTQYWSFAWVPGKKHYDKPLYILTSGRTFSGGEEFAYDYKQLKRAMILGEPTAGGANVGGEIRANADYIVSVPTGRSINPITKTNWEEVGVQPHILVNSNRSLYEAHILALTDLATREHPVAQKEHFQKIRLELMANPPVYRQLHLRLKKFDTAKQVTVSGNFNYWSKKGYVMKKKGNEWIITIEVEPGEVHYNFIVDGRWITDPDNENVVNQNGNTYSRMYVN